MPKSENVIVEIGPGLGDLTQKLLEKRDVIAFEIDKDLCALLQKKFRDAIDTKRLRLICADATKAWKRHLVEQNYDLVANLPYYVATHIILKALEDEHCQNILVMVQKEVAQKFAAKAKEKNFSSLAILAQSAGKVTKLFDVKPEAFVPSPKVDSSVLLIEKRESVQDRDFMHFLKAAFQQPRKTLLKNLSGHYPKKILQEIFAQLHLASTIRPHEVSTSIYHQIFAKLKEKIDGAKSSPKQTPSAQEQSKKTYQ